MKILKSPLANTLFARINEKRPLIQVVLGPRQVGKTTALSQFCDKFPKSSSPLFVSGDGITHSLWIREQWQKAREQGKILVIDEIQKIPNWSEIIKTLWDESLRNKVIMKVVLSGSSSLNLQKGLTESLAGRFELIRAYHWCYKDSNFLRKMTLDEYLVVGGYPGSYRFLEDPNRWQQYLLHSIVETVIGKDILLQITVRSPSLFRQAFYLLTRFPAQIVSYHKLLGQLQDKGNIDLIKYYIHLYESAFLIKCISKYSGSEIRKKGSSPKIILMAPALANFDKKNKISPDEKGRIFESQVGAELIKAEVELFYWSDGDYEVDYICKLQGTLYAIEVKSTRPRKSISMEVFLKKYHYAKCVYITSTNFFLFEKNPIKFLLDQ